MGGSFRGVPNWVTLVTMAKRKSTPKRTQVRTQVVQPKRSSGGGGAVVVVRETAGRVGRAVRRSRATGGEAAGLQKRMQASAIGGFGVGFIEKQFGAQIPSLPVIGRKGAIAMGVYFFKPKSKMIQDVGVAAAALAGYQFGKEGKIDGYDEDFDDE